MNTIAKNTASNGRFIPRTYSDLLDSFLKDSFFENRNGNILPSADIAEDEKAYYLNLVIPGVEKEAIKVELNEGILSVSGEKKFNKEEKGKKYHTIESSYGSFKRSFKLPEDANAEVIEAEYKDGILAVSIAKKEGKNLKSVIQIK